MKKHIAMSFALAASIVGTSSDIQTGAGYANRWPVADISQGPHTPIIGLADVNQGTHVPVERLADINQGPRMPHVRRG